MVVNFSGGKDSTVLLHLVRSIFPDVKGVFSNTGLEYPEIQRFVMGTENVDIIRPSMRFDEVISTYGYPLIGKEVADAIYYSRRIQSQNPSENKHKGEVSQVDRKRNELNGKRVNEKYTEKKSQFNKEKWLPLARDVPFMISNCCCFRMKKSPIKQYQHKNNVYPFLGSLAEESRTRKQAWIRHGCNAFDGSSPTSQPLSFWTEQDILTYIVKYSDSIMDMLKAGVRKRAIRSGIYSEKEIEEYIGKEVTSPIASVYGEIVSTDGDIEMPAKDITGNIGCNLKCTGCQRTGCIFCGFGFHSEKTGETRFQRLARTHPRQYEYSIGGGQWVDNPHYDPTAPEYDGDWKNWNPKKIWVPSKKGLGMGKVFDMANEIYGKDFYRYE